MCMRSLTSQFSSLSNGIKGIPWLREFLKTSGRGFGISFLGRKQRYEHLYLRIYPQAPRIVTNDALDISTCEYCSLFGWYIIKDSCIDWYNVCNNVICTRDCSSVLHSQYWWSTCGNCSLRQYSRRCWASSRLVTEWRSSLPQLGLSSLTHHH
jgi:hypothetical protein